jgi:hypothetical protein
MNIYNGQLTALLGHNGAGKIHWFFFSEKFYKKFSLGKSTTISMITGKWILFKEKKILWNFSSSKV